MTVTALSGPLIVGPTNGTANPANASSVSVSADRGPSQLYQGFAITDPRFPYREGGGTENSALLSVGIGLNADYLVLDQVPAQLAVNNIAAAAAPVSGTAMTLVASSGAGITVLTAPVNIPQTGNNIPTGARVIDLSPGLVFFGVYKSTAVADPTKQIARAVSITTASGGVGGVFVVAGWDVYGVPMSEKITAASSPTGTALTTGKKAFKAIQSVIPQIGGSFTYSIGTSDTYGFPLRCDTFVYARIGWAGSPITSSAGFTAAVTTTATNTTGDVRGTYAVQSSSDGTKSLQFFQSISPANITVMSGFFGVTQA